MSGLEEGYTVDTAHEKDVHVVPEFKGERVHKSTPECWCDPELREDYTDQGGGRLWVHRRPE